VFAASVWSFRFGSNYIDAYIHNWFHLFFNYVPRTPVDAPELCFARPQPGSDWQRLVTDKILAEYLEVFSRPKFGLPSATIERWSDMFQSATTSVKADIRIDFPRDPDDVPILACANVAGADILVTSDGDLLDLGHIGETRVLGVSVAIAFLRKLAQG
jgi:putative PIN family toxin of toxin-antitoxin system